MYEWILIVSIFVGPTSSDGIRIHRFNSLDECSKVAVMFMTFAGNPKDQCIKVLKNE